MKIVHVIITAVYKEGLGYQENILPSKHVELGLDTYVISYNNNFPNGKEYINEDGVIVKFLPINNTVLSKIKYISLFVKKTKKIYQELDMITPDYIFIHGLQCIDSLVVSKWCKKHPSTKLYVDQHADFYNAPIDKWRVKLYRKYLYGYIGRKLEKYAMKFWGVTPWRVDYLQKVYGIAPTNTGLLVMGGDEKFIDWENRAKIRDDVRAMYGIPNDAFLLISGGRIDRTKNIHLLIDAVEQLNVPNIFLLVFGKFEKDIENYCVPKFSNNIKYAGWQDSRQVYPLFLASDLAVFPGTHSVLWEQAMASGIPGIFKDWDGGFSHIDCGGNSKIIKDITVDSLVNEISLLHNDKTLYNSMKQIAETSGRNTFSYIEIAKKSIEL